MKIVTGVDIVHVPYKGVPASLTDLVAGRVEMSFPDMVTAMPLVRSARLRPLAVTSATRSRVMPEVPTMIEAGVAGYEITGWAAAWLPAGVSADIQARLNKLFVDVMQSKEATEFFQRDGWESFAGPPEALAEWQRNETAKWARIIAIGKIQAE